MGQGNAIAHLMPPPFYAYRYVVAKARAPEESIQDQIDKILDASATQRYKIEVMPGIYAETITMKAYVDVVAPYGRVVIQPPSGTAGVTMAANSMLQGVEVNQANQGASATGIVIGDLTNVIVEDCWITGGGAGDIGMSDASTGTSVIIRKCRIDSAATGYQKTAAGTTWLADCRITSGTDGIDVDANLGTLNLMDNELMGTGTGANVDVAGAAVTINSYGNTLAGDGWQIGDSTNAWVYSHDDKFTKVTHAGAGHMVCTEDPQTYLVFNGMKIGDAISAINTIGDASDTKRYLIKVSSGEYSEALTMPQYVDMAGESNQSVVISQTATTVITCAANSRVKSVRVEVTAADNTNAVLANNVYAYLEDVIVIVTHSDNTNSCVASSGTGGFELHDCVLQIDNAASYPVYIDGSGTHLVYDSELINTGTGGYGVFVGAADSLSSFNNKLRSDEGFYLTADASTQVLSYGDDFTSVVWSGATGLFADLTGARLYACDADIAIGEWVYVSDNDTVDEADSDDLATMPTIGVVVYKPSSTTCYVKNYGYYYDAAANSGHGDAFVANEEFWVSGTPGEITTTMPAVWPQRAGIAVSTQRFKILIGDNLGLVHCNEYLCSGAGEAVGEWVYITTTNDTVDEADASDGSKMPAIGVIVQKIDATTALIKLRGKWAEASKGWSAGDDVYIDPATPGAITNVVPGIGVIQKVATVKSDDLTTIIYELAD